MEGLLQMLEAEGLAGFTLLIVVKTTVLLALATGAAWVLRGQSAAVRHTVWTLAAVGVLSLPIAAVSLQVDVPILPKDQASVDDATRPAARAFAPTVEGERVASAGRQQSAESATVAAAVLAPPEVTKKASGLDFGQVLFGAWAVVALGLLGRIAAGALTLRKIASRAVSLEGSDEAQLLNRVCAGAGVSRPVRLVRSEWSDVPMTWGVVRPVVHLPAASSAWDEDRLRVVLEHEVAHVRRWDVLTLVLARAATALHWFNPMAWMAERSLREESERASDDWVLRQGTMASKYAEHILELAHGHVPGRIPATALPMAHRSRFEGRLLAILQPEADRRSVTMKNWIVAGVVAGIGFCGLAAAVPVSAVASPTIANSSFEAEDVATLADEETTSEFAATEIVNEPRVSEILDEAFSTPEAVKQRRADASTPQEVTEADRATLEDPRSVAALSKALLQDSQPEVRRAAAWALGQIEDRAATEALATALESDTDLEVRRTAVWALGQLEDRRGIPALFGALNDADTDVRSQAAWALGKIETEEAVPGLLDALDDQEIKVRKQAVWALGQIESADAVSGLAGMLNDPDAETRGQAAWALGQIESNRATAPLVSALRDENAEVRGQVAWALGQIESEEAVDGLARTLSSDADAGVRSQAAWALGQIEPTRAPQALIDAMGDAHADVRGQALWAIRQIEDPASVDAVVALLASDDLRTQIGALRALAGIRNEAAIGAIAALLENSNADVREAAARALAGNGGWASPNPRPRPRPQPRPRPRGNDSDMGGAL